MPTYEYRCAACEHEFEAFHSITAPALKKCPQCGQRKLQRLIGTGGGVIFKGSGFYETDYRSESYKKAAKADQPATTSSDGDGKGEGKGKGKDGAASSDKKPAAESKPSPKPPTSKAG